ncbi:MAG: hypothetical protein HUN04_12555 [Desulfobacter sp.]|nr:MAG: hypothetical protein HUN04_12555 [Desulfobacter sp.]
MKIGGALKLDETNIKLIAKEISEHLLFSKNWPRWMKLKLAMEYSGYGRLQLLNLAIQKEIVGYQDPDSKRGDWVFDKNSIDEYRLSHFNNDESQIALSILKSL